MSFGTVSDTFTAVDSPLRLAHGMWYMPSEYFLSEWMTNSQSATPYISKEPVMKTFLREVENKRKKTVKSQFSTKMFCFLPLYSDIKSA